MVLCKWRNEVSVDQSISKTRVEQFFDLNFDQHKTASSVESTEKCLTNKFSLQVFEKLWHDHDYRRWMHSIKFLCLINFDFVWLFYISITFYHSCGGFLSNLSWKLKLLLSIFISLNDVLITSHEVNIMLSCTEIDIVASWYSMSHFPFFKSNV